MENFLLQRYRSERRKLLDFILSAGLIREIRNPPGAVELCDVDKDTISIDHVLECVKQAGVLDLSVATRKYYYERDFPIMINSQTGSSYFLHSEAELSGSPPRRMPPQVLVTPVCNYKPSSSNQLDPSVVEEVADSADQDVLGCANPTAERRSTVKDANVLSLGLPTMSVGLSDDDVRETAYEVLLACIAFSGGQIHPVEVKKKEKKSKFLTRLRSKRGDSPPQPTDSHSELLDVIRVQMEISEAMDICTRQGLMLFASRTMSGQLDVAQISLELLIGVCNSDFHNERSYAQWQKRQVKILEELLYNSANVITDGHIKLKSYLSKLRNIEEWKGRMSTSEQDDVLRAVRRFATKFSSMPSKYGIPGETYFWTTGYHLNLRLYEKLLCSVFDILEEGQLVEEAEAILRNLKLTWSTLGITQKMHDALYGWVLFRQFVGTDEEMLLEQAIHKMQTVTLTKDADGNEEAYMNILYCSIGGNGTKKNLNLIDAIFLSMSNWCDIQLQDYHLHFSKNPIRFGRVLTLAVLAEKHTTDECGGTEFYKHMDRADLVSKRIQEYVVMSIQAAYNRALDMLDAKSGVEKRHPLAVLANEVKLIADKESTIFSPKLCRWCPKAGVLPSLLLHQFYGERLKPFLEEAEHLSEDVKSVLPAADILEIELTRILHSACGEDPISESLQPYQVGEISGPIILEWVNAQHANILEWTERAFHLEDWEPLSSQQRQAASIIEVFRIIDETVDQFFNLNLPMDIIHLQSLLVGIVQGLEAYLLKLVSQLVDKNHLYPTVPALTRYKESVTPFIKKKLTDCMFLEDEVIKQLNELTTSKLCVRLNTLQYMQNQIRIVEDTIREGWMLVREFPNLKLRNDQPLKGGLPTCNGSVDKLFSPFNSIRNTADDAIRRICDFIGIRIMFWDLRDSFLFSLYRGNVEGARLESYLPQLDTVLDHVCDLIVDSLRDPVVLSICQASLESYVWVLLDGGPSRAFSNIDIPMMEEDLNILKDFFVANGEGLPCAVVEQEAKLAHEILKLFALQTEILVGMLMSASELISTGVDNGKPGSRYTDDANTLLRVLCHKKDREASKFLKRQYQLPESSDYEESLGKDLTPKSPLISDLLKRTSSFQWTEQSMRSLRSMKKKFQEATYEIKHATR